MSFHLWLFLAFLARQFMDPRNKKQYFFNLFLYVERVNWVLVLQKRTRGFGKLCIRISTKFNTFSELCRFSTFWNLMPWAKPMIVFSKNLCNSFWWDVCGKIFFGSVGRNWDRISWKVFINRIFRQFRPISFRIHKTEKIKLSLKKIQMIQSLMEDMKPQFWQKVCLKVKTNHC